MESVGMPITNENSWAVGHSLRKLAADLGHEPLRILTTKTDPNASVKAPHCIAHYPMEIFKEAVFKVGAMWENCPNNTATQYQLFDERIL